MSSKLEEYYWQFTPPRKKKKRASIKATSKQRLHKEYKYIGELRELPGQLEEKYFDYNGVSLDCPDNLEKNISTTSCSISSTTSASTADCHARGLDAAHSRKLSATLGGSTSTHPGVRKITLKICDFVDINNATIPTAFGARQQLRLRSWLWFYDNNSTTSSSTTPCRPRRTR
jgi:hypothetical protein